MIRKFITVDDDEFNNVLCRLSIELALGNAADITSFEKPEAGLAFIQTHYMHEQEPAILLLDINMPKIDGWEFMEEFEAFPEVIKKQLTVYMVSSSVDPRDMEKAEMNKRIKAFLSKPVSVETVEQLSGITQQVPGAERQ